MTCQPCLLLCVNQLVHHVGREGRTSQASTPYFRNRPGMRALRSSVHASTISACSRRGGKNWYCGDLLVAWEAKLGCAQRAVSVRTPPTRPVTKPRILNSAKITILESPGTSQREPSSLVPVRTPSESRSASVVVFVEGKFSLVSPVSQSHNTGGLLNMGNPGPPPRLGCKQGPGSPVPHDSNGAST